MAQVRRPPRYRSPPALQIPSLPNPIRFQPPTFNTKHIIVRQNDISHNRQFHPVTGLMIVPNNLEQSLTSFDRQQLISLEESMILPPLNDDSEILEKKHLPVYAQFPFNVSLLPQPMEINIEDNIHKLRLRLIDSELKHQRRSTDEYIKRTHRIGMENDLPNSSDIDRELETRRIQESLNKRRRSNHQINLSKYSYDPRLHLEPLNEEQIYISPNVDDLIDSMARRHLASRRFDRATDRQRRNSRHHGQYTESSNTGRTPYRNGDSLTTDRSYRTYTERDYARTNPNGFNKMVRSRVDYYNRIQSDHDGMRNDDSVRTNPYTKLPPISPGHNSNRLNHETKNNSHRHQPNSADQSEHFMDLPSDIFLSSQTTALGSEQRTRRTRPRSVSKDTRSGTDRSDGENEIPKTNRPKKSFQNDNHGFFTEYNHKPKKNVKKKRRHLFQKYAIGILFLIALKHRSDKNRSRRLQQSPSASIHKIRLQEMIVGLHRVYLEPDGPIYNALIQAITNPISLQNGLDSSSKHYSEAIKIIGNALTNIISKMTEFMPKDGVLGTEKTSAVSALIQDGNEFPENYFWECERELLEFDNFKIMNITKQRAILLLIGIFIFRALVTTLLIKPIKYRVILGKLTPNQSVNLKVLASVILYIGRRAAGPKSHILTLPHEWQLSLYPDTDIRTILHHSELKPIIDTCEQSLRIWCEEYIRRIDKSFNKELRK